MLEVEVVPPGVSREPCIAIHGSAGGVRRIRHIGVDVSVSQHGARAGSSRGGDVNVQKMEHGHVTGL